VSPWRFPRRVRGQFFYRSKPNKENRQANITNHIEIGQRPAAAKVTKIDMRRDVLPTDPLKRLCVQLVPMLADERFAHALGIVECRGFGTVINGQDEPLEQHPGNRAHPASYLQTNLCRLTFNQFYLVGRNITGKPFRR
ncbi:uncharacterized protein METZ01_LOCUS417729, partial [marine metagenome]